MNKIAAYLILLRPKHWVKNLFLFIPIFFAGQFLLLDKLVELIPAFFSFSLCASAIYIYNDYQDIEADRAHPKKSKRPLASGQIGIPVALGIIAIVLAAGLLTAYFISLKFLFVLGIYLLLNLAYSSGLKRVGILDIFIVAAGFVLRVKAGGVATGIPISAWLNVMIFLLALLLTIAKRRDDVLLKGESGKEMRKSTRNYNLDLMNSLIVMVSGIIIVAYLIYTLSPNVIQRFETHRLYYTAIFVIAGIMRYLQLVFVDNDTGSPTNILYKDRFIQATIVLWILSFAFLIYFPDLEIFNS